jgi:hypothetical protein
MRCTVICTAFLRYNVRHSAIYTWFFCIAKASHLVSVCATLMMNACYTPAVLLCYQQGPPVDSQVACLRTIARACLPVMFESSPSMLETTF